MTIVPTQEEIRLAEAKSHQVLGEIAGDLELFGDR
jgi:hypothetical protein